MLRILLDGHNDFARWSNGKTALCKRAIVGSTPTLASIFLLDNFGGAVAPGRKSLIVNDLRHEKKVKKSENSS